MRSPRAATVVPLLAVLATLFLGILVVPLDARAQSPLESIRERIRERPADPTLYFFQALFEAAAGETAACVTSLVQVERLGKGFLPDRGFGFDNVWNDPGFQAARGRLEAALPRVVAAREIYRLDSGLIPEGIAFDARTNRYYVGSIAQRKIIRMQRPDSAGSANGAPANRVADFSRPGELEHVLGLAIDTGRRRLYAVSTNGFTEAGAKSPVNAVAVYDLDAGTQVRSISVAGAAALNDVAVAPDGTLFVTDTGSGAVFHVRADNSVDTVLAPGSLSYPNGIAVSPSGAAVYVAHSTGIARFDVAADTLVARIDIPVGESVAAIDGLYAHGTDLIGVQNVINPGRVIRMRLRRDGLAVERVETLLSHHHEALDQPTTGVLAGRTFALLATTQVSRFTSAGVIESPETLKQPVVLEIALDR